MVGSFFSAAMNWISITLLARLLFNAIRHQVNFILCCTNCYTSLPFFLFSSFLLSSFSSLLFIPFYFFSLLFSFFSSLFCSALQSALLFYHILSYSVIFYHVLLYSIIVYYILLYCIVLIIFYVFFIFYFILINYYILSRLNISPETRISTRLSRVSCWSWMISYPCNTKHFHYLVTCKYEVMIFA